MARTIMLFALFLPMGLIGAAECSCRSPAGDVVVGQTICLVTVSGARLATCKKVLNNTSWAISTHQCEPAAT